MEMTGYGSTAIRLRVEDPDGALMQNVSIQVIPMSRI